MPARNVGANTKSFCAPWEKKTLRKNKRTSDGNLDKADQGTGINNGQSDRNQQDKLQLPLLASRPRSRSVAARQKPRNNFIEPREDLTQDDLHLPPISRTGSMTSRPSNATGAPARWPGSNFKIPRHLKHMEDDFETFLSFPHTQSVASLQAPQNTIRVSSLPRVQHAAPPISNTNIR